jgi:thymidylate kinase
MSATETVGVRDARPPAEARTPRQAFVHRLVEVFDSAGLEYVVLHAFDPAETRDSDVDVAVEPASLCAADALIRTGRLGRLLQCLHYDVPWCRYYVLRAREDGRRYRQVDVGCDPWGIGRYGPAIPVALGSPERVAGIPVPRVAARCVYLAAKRARKGAEAAQLVPLRAAFAEDPEGATELLVSTYGRAGAELARALGEQRADLSELLDAVALEVARARRSPSLLARRIPFEVGRIGGRVLRPTGLAVTLAGPDGTGKSTLAHGLATEALGAFRQVSRLHLGPGVLPPPGRLLGRAARDSAEPHGATPSGLAGSLARLAYLFADAWLGWLARVTWPRMRSGLVLLERGWWDLAVDPRRYRLSSPPRLTRTLGRIAPRTDLVLVLDAPAPTVRARKPELGIAEVVRQLGVWRAIAASDPKRHRVIDTARPRSGALEEAVGLVDTTLAGRHTALDESLVALRCLGRIRSRGRRYTLVSARGRPRWLLPTESGGPIGWHLYRPPSALRAGGALALEVAGRVGAPFGRLIELDPADGLGPKLAATFGCDTVELAAAIPTDARRRGRVVLAIRARGRLVGFAKVDADGRGTLERERAVLEALEACAPASFAVPRVLDAFEWEGADVMVLGALDGTRLAAGELEGPELRALAELASLPDSLGTVLRPLGVGVPVHGDFTPWNAARTGAGRLALWDWEEAHLGLPLEDLFSWRARVLIHLGRGSADALVRGAYEPDRQVSALATASGSSPDEAPRALEAALERIVAGAGPDGDATSTARRALQVVRGRR